MEREAYQVPSGTAAGGRDRGAVDYSGARSQMHYICGDCGSQVSLGKDAVISCPLCSGRVLYKERTKRMVQFEAR